MNCNTPTDICFSFAGFRARGGLTDQHRDGFGIAFFEDKGVRLFLDPKASAESPVAELINNYPIRSHNVIAHIRKATQGNISLENTHPFQRELWGRYWAFAHNGHIEKTGIQSNGRYHPVGSSDSEQCFCFILNSLSQIWDSNPKPQQLLDKLQELAIIISQAGECNFLLSNGDVLFAHCSTRLSYIIRQAPFSLAHLADEDIVIDFNKVTTANDRVAIIATTPLTNNESWHNCEPGTLYMFQDGLVIAEHVRTTLAGTPYAPCHS